MNERQQPDGGPGRAAARAVALARLRRRIRALEPLDASAGRAGPPLGFGAPAVDAWLPGGGLAPAALHEFLAEGGAGLALLAALAGRRAAAVGRPILWCLRQPRRLHAPAIAALGLPATRLILAAATGADALWAMEEGLKSGRLAAVVGEAAKLELVPARRLLLAAERGATPCLLLRPAGSPALAGASLSRWRVTAAPSDPTGHAGLGPPRLLLELVRCRGGNPAQWIVEWQDAPRAFAVVAALAERAVEPRPALADRAVRAA